jgi:endonuclease YncB( thermonuclease family)
MPHQPHQFGIACNPAYQMLVCLVVTVLLVACNQIPTTSSSEGGLSTTPIALPTPAPTRQPTPVNTRVLPVEVLTPQPTPSLTPIPDEVAGLVIDVIDGDTLAVVLDGDRARQAYTVRLVGIDAPENISSNPWGVVAYETNKKLAKLKIVRLVRDQTDFDAEGYLLRYVYIDNQLLNVTLVQQGLARAAIKAPDTRFETTILAAEAEAKAQQRGLWNPQAPTPTIDVRPTAGTEEAQPTTRAVTTTLTSTVQPQSTVAATQETTEEATGGTSEPTTEPTEESTPENN